MELCKKLGLVFFATQPGATFESFDASRCRREVILPAQEVLLQGNLLYTLLFVISCDRQASIAEASEEAFLPGEGPGHLETPTSRELLNSMRRERSERLFEYLNIPCWGDRHATVEGYAVEFVRASGADGVLVIPRGGPFPSVRDLCNVLAYLERGQVQRLGGVPVPA